MAHFAGVRREYRRNFFLDEAKLRKIVSVVSEAGEKLKRETWINFHVGRKDDSFFDTDRIDDILGDDNAGPKRIQHLILDLYPGTVRPEQLPSGPHRERSFAFISFDETRETRVRFGVAGEDREWCVLLADELDAQIQRTLATRFFAFLESRAFDLSLMICFLAAVFITGSWYALKSMPHYSPAEIALMSEGDRLARILEVLTRRQRFMEVGPPLMMLFLLTFIAVVELHPFSRIAKKLQRPVFYWGDAASEHDRVAELAGRVKWGVGIAFIVSVIAGVLTAWFMR